MCQAAAEGVVDFTRGDPRSRFWWLDLTIRLDHLEGRNVDVIRRMNHEAAVALLSRSDLADDSMDKLREHAGSLVMRVKKSLFPWVDFDETTDVKRAIASMKAQWIAEWGDPDAPETIARIEATAAALAAQLVVPAQAPPPRKPAARPRTLSTKPRRRPGRP